MRTPAQTLKRLAAAVLILLTGCSAAPVALLPIVPALIEGAGSGISYTFTNIAYKTMTYPMGDVVRANAKALEKMSITIDTQEAEEYEVRIRARTRKFAIHITIEAMTPTLTKIRVNAKRLLFLKDKTTAFEVIFQTERFLIGIDQGQGEGAGATGAAGAGGGQKGR